MRKTTLIAVSIVAVAGLSPAQDLIFADDFEWGSICAWSNLWYVDSDGDDWGATGTAGVSVSCPPPGGYAPNQDDCDDISPLINPGEDELCDSIDNDCDLDIDEDATCNDNLSCTTDYCDGVNGCQASINSDACLISGVCYSHGQTMPLNQCLMCNSAVSQTTWSYNDGVECDDGDECTTDDRCLGGVCVGDPILDPFEPNDSMAASVDLGSTNLSDPFPFDSLNANLYPNADPDWFRYYVDDTPDGDVRPRVELSNVPPGTNYNLCAYFECDEEYQDFQCIDGTSVSWNGIPGCCSTNAGSSNEWVHLDPNCGSFINTNDSGTVYIRVYRGTSAVSCADYTVEWGNDSLRTE